MATSSSQLTPLADLINGRSVASIGALPAAGDFLGEPIYVTNVDVVCVWNGTSWIPNMYAEAAGQASLAGTTVAAGAAVNTPITFPVGRFSVAPRVTATINGIPGGSNNLAVRVATVTTAGASLYLYNTGASAATWAALPIDWRAVQALSTGASS